MRNEKGVSPMIATIVLIFIVFAIAAAIIVALASAPRPTPPFGGVFMIERENDLPGSFVGDNVIVIKHTGGDTLYDAFDCYYGVDNENKKYENYYKYRNLEVRVNGILQENIIYVISGGENILLRENILPRENILGTENIIRIERLSAKLVAGDLFKVQLDNKLELYDRMVLIYTPLNQMLLDIKVT